MFVETNETKRKLKLPTQTMRERIFSGCEVFKGGISWANYSRIYFQ